MKSPERYTAHRQDLARKVHDAGVKHPNVLQAIATVPRHTFVDAGLHAQAYEDSALPIGHQQTISKPSVVGRMVELLHKNKQPLGKVLEIGTGCGYQAAVLSLLAKESIRLSAFAPYMIWLDLNYAPFGLQTCALFMGMEYGDSFKRLPSMALFWLLLVWVCQTPYWIN